MAVVDDYLDDPARGRGRAAPARPRPGRLAMGPWYILMDEFLVSGETIVRNLQLGPRPGRRASAAPWRSATCPTCSATSPRCPSSCASSASSTPSCGGACPPAVDRTAFWWAAPDGSTVRAEYLPDGLRQRRGPARRRQGAARRGSTGSCRRAGRPLAGDPDPLDERHRPPDAPAVAGPGRGRGQRPPGRLPRSRSRRCAEHLAGGARPTGLPVVDGRAALGRPGQPAHGRGVEPGRRASRPRRAPSAPSSGWPSRCRALFLPADRWPGALPRRGVARGHPQLGPRLDLRLLGRRGRADAVLHRYDEARQIAEGLTDRAARPRSPHAVGADGPVVVNPSARARSGAGRARPSRGEATSRARRSVRRARPRSRLDRDGSTGVEFGAAARPDPRASELDDGVRSSTWSTIDDARRRRRCTLARRRPIGEPLSTGDAVRAARRRWSTPRRRAGPTSRSCSGPASACSPGSTTCPASGGSAGRRPSRSTSSRSPSVRIDRAGQRPGRRSRSTPPTAPSSLDGVPGFGRLVDDGDVGDTYNYSPARRRRRRRPRPTRWRSTCSRTGRCGAALAVDRDVHLARAGVDGGARVGDRDGRRAHARSSCGPASDLVRVDHRARQPVPRPPAAGLVPAARAGRGRRGPSARSPSSSGASTAEGGPTERGAADVPVPPVRAGRRPHRRPRGPARVRAGRRRRRRARRLGAHAAARHRDALPQRPMAYRPLPAGPPIATEAAADAGPARAALRACSVGDADPYALGRRRLPAAARRRGSAPASATARERGQRCSRRPAPRCRRCVRRRPGGSRCGCSTRRRADHRHASTAAPGWLVDLRGRPLEPFDGAFELAPWRIATALIAPLGLRPRRRWPSASR